MDLNAVMEAVTKLGLRIEALQNDNSGSYIRKDELDKTIGAYIEKAHPVKKPGLVLPGQGDGVDATMALLQKYEEFKQRKEAYSTPLPWESEYGSKFKNMHGFLRAIKMRSLDLRMIEMDGAKASGDAMTEGTGSSGGFLVPTEFNYEVIRLERAETFIRQIARMFPMSTWKRTLPRQLTNVSVAWVDEFGAKSTTNPTFEQMTQQAKVLAAVIKSSDELLRDTAVNLNLFLAELVADAEAAEIERVALAGDVSGAGDPFNGVYYATGVVTQAMAGASLAYDDIINQKFSISAAYDKDADWVLNRTALKLVMKLKAPGSGEYLWSAPRDGNPGQIIDRPYHLSDQLPTTLGAGAETPILYGNYKKFLWLSDREGMAVKVSTEASDWVSGALDSAFMTDQTWLRFTRALSIDVAYGAAFSRMLVK